MCDWRTAEVEWRKVFHGNACNEFHCTDPGLQLMCTVVALLTWMQDNFHLYMKQNPYLPATFLIIATLTSLNSAIHGRLTRN